MITARLAKNKYDNEISINGEKVEVVSAALRYEGKRRLLVLEIADFDLLPESKCPERHRFELILQAAGSKESITFLGPECDLLKVNAGACSGCPERPL